MRQILPADVSVSAADVAAKKSSGGISSELKTLFREEDDMRKKEVSVIIPVHNTDLGMFSNCIRSLKNQEIGFENIELVVVLHNCNAETVAGVRDILAPSDGVVIAELNNESHSPSSPRNHGIDLATGDYLTFLDADDMLTPECLRLSLEYIKEAGADLCHFRKKIQMEQEGKITFNELVLWDQTQEMTAISIDALDHRMYFVGAWGMSTGKLFRRQLLVENNLRFDESIKFAEDYHFMLCVFGKVRSICLAPQLIGYIYFVNGNSLVQTTKITEELLLDYVAGFQKVFDKGIENHIWMNDTMGSIMLIILNWMYACTDLTDEGRQKVMAYMEPYIRSLEPVKPSKLYPAGKSYRMNAYLSRYILDEETELETFIARDDEGIGQTFIDRQKDALSGVMGHGIHSDYSRHYGFDRITTIEEYDRRLPVSDYNLYCPMIELTIQMGERGIFTDNEISAYALVYGKEPEPERIPMTEPAIVPYVHALRKSLGTSKTFPVSEALPFKASHLTMDFKYTNSVYGVILKAYIAEAESFGCGYATFTTPKEYLFPEKEQDMRLMRLVWALKERDVESIFAPDPESLCSCLKDLARNWEGVCGKIEETDRERADELRALFLSGKKPALREIWPSVRKVVCWNATDDRALDDIKPWFSDVSFSRGYYADAYALYGEICGDSGEVELDADYVFYEFVQLSGNAEKAVCTAADISEGEVYKLLVSNLSGLYRYDTGMSVKCVHTDGQKVVVKGYGGEIGE